ncbi:MAG: glycosyltransferase [Candidatus Sericytochromatia bacterium]|nr:glycosyltransferase [Candidatus Sericytochromatia bacterium]
MALIKKKKIEKESEIQKLNISVCIITKDSENLIEDCIKSISDVVREIIVVDLGSTDSTVDIVKKYTNRVFWHKWNKDYSEIRNFFSKYISSEWVLHMDAHERLSKESKKFFTDKLLSRTNIAYLSKTINMYQDAEVESHTCRLFRRNNEIKFKLVFDESATDDIQRIGRRDNLNIAKSDLVFDRYNYLKYFDESELHAERIELARHGLEDKKISPTIRMFYKLNLGLSLNSLGEHDDAEEIILEVLEDIRKLDKKIIYNTPVFMQAYLFFAFKYSKKEKFKEGLELMKEGIEIYNNSLTMLIRYAEFLYVNELYKDCMDCMLKIKYLLRDENYYIMEAINFELIAKLGKKLDNLSVEKYLKAQEANESVNSVF